MPTLTVAGAFPGETTQTRTAVFLGQEYCPKHAGGGTTIMSNTPFNLSLLDRFRIPRRHFSAGEKIFLEEDIGDQMYVVLEGKVSIVTYGTVLENIGVQGTFGEMALMEDAPRSASAMAVEPTDVGIIDRATFIELVRKEPEFSLYVMRQMASRIRRMNKSL